MFAFTRIAQGEWMDQGRYTKPEFFECLEQLKLINRLTGGFSLTSKMVDDILVFHQIKKNRTVRLIDLGCGAGETLLSLERQFQKAGQKAELVGIDLNPLCLELAKQRVGPSSQIQWVCDDAWSWLENHQADIVINSFFLHHLPIGDAKPFCLRLNQQVQLGWAVNDLIRSPIAWASIFLTSRLFRMNRLIKHDGPLSVRRALDWAEWRALKQDLAQNGAKTELVRTRAYRAGLWRAGPL